MVHFDGPADKFKGTRLQVWFRYFLAHLVVKVSVQVIHGLLVVLRKCVHKRRQQVLHILTLVLRCVSRKGLDLSQLLLSCRGCHRGFQLGGLVLNPLFEGHGSVWVLVVRLSPKVLCHRRLQLA